MTTKGKYSSMAWSAVFCAACIGCMMESNGIEDAGPLDAGLTDSGSADGGPPECFIGAEEHLLDLPGPPLRYVGMGIVTPQGAIQTSAGDPLPVDRISPPLEQAVPVNEPLLIDYDAQGGFEFCSPDHLVFRRPGTQTLLAAFWQDKEPPIEPGDGLTVRYEAQPCELVPLWGCNGARANHLIATVSGEAGPVDVALYARANLGPFEFGNARSSAGTSTVSTCTEFLNVRSGHVIRRR